MNYWESFAFLMPWRGLLRGYYVPRFYAAGGFYIPTLMGIAHSFEPDSGFGI